MPCVIDSDTVSTHLTSGEIEVKAFAFSKKTTKLTFYNFQKAKY